MSIADGQNPNAPGSQTEALENKTDEAGHAGHDAHHDPNLAHHFNSLYQQFSAAKLGMWAFLATELLMFSGLFVAYAVYHNNHIEVFRVGHEFLDWKLGAVNTVILLLSSFTMAWAVRTAQLNARKATTILLCLTLLGGVGFMLIKSYEYGHKFELGLAPGVYYDPSPKLMSDVDVHDKAADDAAHADHGSEDHGHKYPQFTEKEMITARPYFSIYFALTGLHGLHVLIGMGLITWILIKNLRGKFTAAYYTPVDLVGLYWHLVDLIWIFLFPLLYLVE